VVFLSVDLYDTWGYEIVKKLPNDLPINFYKHDFRHIDFIDFDLSEILENNWNRLLIFWDVNDEIVARKMINNFLPKMLDRNVLICMHDVSNYSGRPKRFRWRNYESLYKDLVIVGGFIDQYNLNYGMPDTKKIFGHYRNAGHWLLFETTGSLYSGH
jgi:NADPH-dependent curcumin reductase CurA